ncbi:MAG: DNA adenine methylase [Deinococcales bacterium]
MAARPFLKWAGGKTQLLNVIQQHMPYQPQDSFNYVEPFVGGASVLFWMINHYPKLQRIIINDLNADLINSYRCLAQDVKAVIRPLAEWQALYDQLKPEQRRNFYYQQRALYNHRSSEKSVQAALLIFLNKTCFNGLYRVNKKDQFNVPMGRYAKPLICDEANLFAVHKALQRVEILQGDYQRILAYLDEASFIYLDPPYKPISPSSNFNHYASHGFNDTAQIDLKNFCDILHQKGVKWLLSNSDVNTLEAQNDFFDNLYHNYHISRVLASRTINAKSSARGKLSELLIRNFNL